VGRPASPPRGGGAALSWGCAAIQGHSGRPARAHIGFALDLPGVSTPSRFRRDGAPEPVSRTGAPPSLPLPFRGPSPHPRTVPSGEPTRRTMLPLLGSLSLRHVPGRRTREMAGSPAPDRVPRARFRTSFAASTTVPPDARRRRSVHGIPPPRRSPRTRSVLLSESLPSCRCARSATPVREGGRRRLQGVVPGASPCVARSLAGARVDAFLGFAPPGRSPSPSRPTALVRGASPFTLRGVTSTVRARPGVSRIGEVGSSLSGLPALLGSAALRPSRRRVRPGTGSGRMVSPHGSRALQAARTGLCSLVVGPTEV
jgi:hypothetical protein